MKKTLGNVSTGGLAFSSKIPYEQQALLKIRITIVNPVFEAAGRVVWCRKAFGNFDIGIEFVEAKDSFKIRMVEQICRIEHYKNEIQAKEGRALSGREAALEWIGKHAGSFEQEAFEKVEI